MKKILGIVGGMGPWATGYLFNKIISLTDAKSDQDHIRIIIDNNTNIPDRTKAILYNGENPVHEIVDSIRMLERCGAQIVAIPCNTAHYFFDEYSSEANAEILNIIDITVRQVHRIVSTGKRKKVGVLATAGTLKTNLYQSALGNLNIDYVVPNDKQINGLMHFIYDGVKANNMDETLLAEIKKIFIELTDDNVDIFILGCTELSVLMGQDILSPYLMVDSTTELAKACILKCGYKTI